MFAQFVNTVYQHKICPVGLFQAKIAVGNKIVSWVSEMSGAGGLQVANIENLSVL